jgi:hypothetical protein
VRQRQVRHKPRIDGELYTRTSVARNLRGLPRVGLDSRPSTEARMSKSSKHSEKPWTESDVAELQAFVEEEMSVEEMVEELGRVRCH